MTLILTVANKEGVYQSSDYQLTDQATGKFVSDRAGSKQLEATFKDFDLKLAFTGIAYISAGRARRRTTDWLADVLKAMSRDSSLQEVCDKLADRFKNLGHALELILTVSAREKPFRVAVISNANWHKQGPVVKPTASVQIHTINKPFYRISGYRKSVKLDQKFRLSSLARDTTTPAADILKVLSEINATAAKHSNGMVSEGCWVTSQVLDGDDLRSSGINVGQHSGTIQKIQEGFDVSDWVKKNFKAKDGEEITLVQSASVSVGPKGGKPLPPPTGPQRDFNYTSGSGAFELKSASGSVCAVVAFIGESHTLNGRLNEEWKMPISNLTLKAVAPFGSDYPRPLLPWPQFVLPLQIDGVSVPRDWTFSLVHWVEAGVLRVHIPVSSRSVRKIAFLGRDEEFVIVQPSEQIELALNGQGYEVTATVMARVSWRVRPDGTID